MKRKIFSLGMTALLLISINGIFNSKEVEKESVKNAQDPSAVMLRLPYQH
ncbi:hypothetical protein [Aneurinibacillus thermoaerophilus]|uniref:Uncharacterized protein n=1 Tax=Aneurinibacillus thermoaerophilus TaxID=143495 RepID=A0ABX8YAF5_ANETH|nr:hypothetical protein [Aneurinibacillus thermoaerophilus]MED0681200.1 hypothetical protein [Aneurinibacillus thermoaerophilus]MED0735440.1 hypothetical protein [Aneurinibacillus thermoaerophilus]MED0757309.1 hypothetical protein [Aneurinibacillus thermoaerophilus]MED0761440.1 hypothetical protein [Aneurinibacillus thermoaerophilus]MED0763558.1 hypothetical protein [Aneurinibacillus thermoaerophilus]